MRSFKALIALGLLLGATVVAEAQGQTLPPNTVLGRTGISPGPAQAIPFATLTGLLMSSGGSTTFNNITGPRSGSWFAPSVNLLRWNDRIFAGDTAAHYPATSGPFLGNTCASGDWFSNFEGTTLPNGTCGYIGIFQTVVESDASIASSTGGLLAAAQSKNAGTNQGTIGLMGFGLNNGTGTTFPTWGGYFECDHTVNHEGCVGIEIDVGNMVSDAAAGNPDAFTQGALPTLQLACGSGLSSPAMFKCSSAIQIVNNANAFKVGIDFLNTSIATQSIFGGTVSVAAAMPLGYGMAWYSSAGVIGGGYFFDGSGNFVLADSGMKINGVTAVSCAAGTVNAATMVVTNGIVTHC